MSGQFIAGTKTDGGDACFTGPVNSIGAETLFTAGCVREADSSPRFLSGNYQGMVFL
jgi:hypothetical protein